MADLFKRNNALRVNDRTANGATADIGITVRGSDFLWAWCAVMGFATLVFVALSTRKPRTHRVFYYITAAMTMTAFVSYFSMASNLGFTPIPVEFRRSDPKVRGIFRQIFYVRYIDWFITTALILMDLLLTAGLPWPTILWAIFVDWFMIVCGLAGALTQSRYKWGYFAFGCAALLYIIYLLVWEGRKHANARGTDVNRVYTMCVGLQALLWILYPIAWGLSEGGNVIAPDSEMIFYGVLDFFSKVVFGALLIWGHRNIDPARLGLRIRDYDDDPAVHGSFFRGGPGHEKHTNGTGVHAPGTNGVHDGPVV